MKRFVSILASILIWGIVGSCHPSRRSMDAFKLREYCHKNRDMNLSEKLRSDGYYSYRVEERSFVKNRPIPERYCVFYSNGSAIFDYEVDYFKEAKDRFFGFYNRGTQWGSYTIEGDTIRILVAESPGSTSWLSSEYTFKFDDRESIRLIYVRSPDYPEKGILNYFTTDSYISEA